MRMRKLCPNLEREDGLDTVLEVPIPEEMFNVSSSSKSNNKSSSSSSSSSSNLGCSMNMLSWMRGSTGDHRGPPAPLGRGAELQLMLGVAGAPLVPMPVRVQHFIGSGAQVKEAPIESSMAKYILHQYVAATGGKTAFDSITSMYAMGKVRMVASEFCSNNDNGNGGSNNNKRAMRYIGGEMGGFVLWQKKPDLWCLELVVSGSKMSAGSDGKVAWRQTPWQQSHASRGPPRPLRRTIQGLDPRSTANLFSTAICIGEKTINNEDCFMLRLDAEPVTLRARSSSNVEIIRHTLWGYFSQRTGLLVQLDDSHLLRMKGANNVSVYWETMMESTIEDYRFIDGINIAHSGRTQVSLFRFGENSDGHMRTKIEEAWTLEEIDFNIRGLSMDCFLAPADLKEEKENCDVVVKRSCVPIRVQAAAAAAAIRIGGSKVAAVNVDDFDSMDDENEKL